MPCFSDIIGQQQVKQQLLDAVKMGRVPHAQLFYGLSGVGKLPMALAYAQYVCCERPKTDDACGVCPSCVKFAKLAHPDLHFVFPIIKRGSKSVTVCDEFVQEFRQALLNNPYLTLSDWQHLISEGKQTVIYTSEGDEIIRKLNLKAYESPYKVMIIWCPERMHESCANRLLKILEEPPGQTLFLLISDTPEELLGTIQSRVQRIHVPPIKQNILLAAAEERFPEVDRGELNAIVKNALGSWARLEQLLAENEQTAMLFDYFTRFFRLAWTLNIKEIRSFVDELYALGRQGQISFLQLAQREIRENFILHIQQPALSYMNASELAFASKFSVFIHEKNIGAIMENFEIAEAHIEQNANGRIVLFDLILKLYPLLKISR